MACTQGTADDYTDLLNKVADFVTTDAELTEQGQHWEILKRVDIGYYFKAPGLSGKEQIYINMDCLESEKQDYYNWSIRGAQGFDSTQSMADQPRATESYLTLWNKAIPYWLIANGQRLIVVAKVSTHYTFCYLGKFCPYATPGQYPYPVVIAGDARYSDKKWSEEGSDHRTLQSPYKTTVVYLPGGESIPIERMSHGFYEQDVDLFPTHEGMLGSNVVQQNKDGGYTLLHYILYSFEFGTLKSSYDALGELDGVYWVTGHNNFSGNQIEIKGTPHLVIQNVYRTSWRDYCAIALK